MGRGHRVLLLAVLAILSGLSGCSSTTVHTGVAAGRCGAFVSVRPGDTLSEIAHRCRVSLKTLARLNGLEPPYMIRAGQRLRLTGSGAHPHAPAARVTKKSLPPRLAMPVNARPRWDDKAAFFPVPIATPVHAAAKGKVVAVQELPFYGRVVLLSHPHGYLSVYGFLLKPLVRPGQVLKQGQRVGLSGVNPETGEPGVYFELRAGKHRYPVQKVLKTE